MFARKSKRASRRRALLATAAALAGFGASAALAATPISGAGNTYQQSDVGSTVTPDFQGGTLQDNQNNVTDANAYTVENFPTNTIDAFGNKTTFSGNFTGGGPLTITDSVGGGAVVFTGTNSYSGTTLIDSGATLQLGAGSGFGLLAGAITDNGSLVFDGGNGALAIYATGVTGTGSLTLNSGTLELSGTNTYGGSTTVASGATLALVGTGSIAASSGVAADGTLDISGTTSGASITSLSGSGSVALGGQNLTLTGASGTFSGAITDGGLSGGTGGSLTIAGGTEILTGVNTFTGTTLIKSGATLQLGDGSGSVGLLAGAITDNGSLVFNGGNGSLALYATGITGSGGLTLQSGTLELTGVNSYSGTTLIDSGATLQLGAGSGFGLLAGAITDNGSLVFDGGNGALAIYATGVTGSGSLTLNSGTLELSGTNTYSGSTTVASGATLALVGTGSIAASSGVAADGTFDISGTTSGASITSLSGSGSVALGGQNLTLTGASGTFSGAITDGGLSGGTGGSLTIAGGTEILTGVNTFTGTTLIKSGATLQLGDGSGSVGLLAGAITDNGSLVFNGGNGSLALYATGITGSGSLTLSSGTLELIGTNTYTGLTTVDSGATLALVGSGSIADSGDPLVNGTFDISGTTSGASVVSLSGSGSVILGAKTLTLTGAADTFSGVISGAGGGLTIAGGTETLTGVNTFTGTTLIHHGATLRLGDGGGVVGLLAGPITDNGSIVFNGGAASLALYVTGITGSGSLTLQTGTLELQGTNTYSGATTIDSGSTLALIGTGSIASSSGVAANGTFDISQTGSGASITSLSGSGTVKLGDQTLTLTDASGTFAGVFTNGGQGTGGVTIQGGTEIVTGASNINGTVTIDSGATMQWGAGGPAYLVGAGNGVVDNGALVIDYGGGGVGGTMPISGTGTLEVKTGSLNEAGVSTYTGVTTIDAAGALLLSNAGSIANSSNVIANGLLDISGTTAGASIITLSGAGNVSLGHQTLTLTNASGTFSGVLADGGLYGGTGGALTIAGGTETLTGTNTYTGATTIDLGATLKLGAGGTTGTVAGNVVDNGLVQFDYSGPVTTPNTFSGGGAAEVVAGTVVVTGASNLGGTVTIDSGATMQWGAGGPAYLVGAGNGVVDNGALVIDYGGGGVGGTMPITGTGTLEIKTGSLNEAGVSTYTGATTIDAAGALLLSNAGSIANSSNVIANGLLDISGTTAGASIITLSGAGNVSLGGQTLTLTNASGTFSGVLADGGLYGGSGGGVTIAGGTETLTGANTYTGGTTINAGARLQLGAGGTSGSLVGNVVDNGTLVFDRSDSVIFTGTISGAGGLTQAGTGTTILNGTNTVSGLTTVAAGVLEVGDAGHPGAVLDSHLGGVVVGAGGTLAGHGAINGAVSNGGIVAPGGTIGTLTVASYTQGAAGTLAIEVAPGQASQLNVLGAASLNGTLALTFDAGTYGAHVYEIVAGAPVSGTFSTIAKTGLTAGVVAGLTYASGQVDLVTEATAPATAYGGLSTATLDRAQSFASLVEDSFGGAACADGSVAGPKAAASDACNGMRAWAQVIGSTDHVSGVDGGFGFNNKGAGFIGGIDRRWGEGAALGAAFGYADNDFAMNGALSSASGRSFFGGVYGRWTQGPVQLDGQGYYMKTDWPLRRVIAGYGTATSSPDGDSEGFLIQASAPIGQSGVRPYLRFAYARFSRNAVTEAGVGSLGYEVLAGAAVSSLGEAGFIYAPASVQLGGHPLAPVLRVGVQEDFSGRFIPVSASLAGVAGTDFTVDYAKPGRTAGVADASVKVGLTQTFQLTGEIRGRFGANQSEGVASVGGVLRF
jgi:fibronectin-binding autotransporter adhesin